MAVGQILMTQWTWSVQLINKTYSHKHV